MIEVGFLLSSLFYGGFNYENKRKGDPKRKPRVAESDRLLFLRSKQMFETALVTAGGSRWQDVLNNWTFSFDLGELRWMWLQTAVSWG